MRIDCNLTAMVYNSPMEWKMTPGLTPYPEALAAMAARVGAIQRAEAQELVWLVEHPPLYTLGSSARASDVIGAGGIPTYPTGRGGQVTYHGPGQRVVYVLRDLKRHAGADGPDIRAYVQQLERWLILTLAAFGVEGFTRAGRVGVWVDQGLGVGGQGAGAGLATYPSPCTIQHTATPLQESKIAAIGVRVQKWVTSHGISLNVNPNLDHYAGIVPCGIREFGVTSLAALGVDATMDAVDAALRAAFAEVFGGG